MCEAKVQPVKLLIVKSVTELSTGKKCCAVNNGSPHVHRVAAENQRREKVHVKGRVDTRSTAKQLTFSVSGNSGSNWDVDFLAYGQVVSSQYADVSVHSKRSGNEDIVADLEYKYDDPFTTTYTPLSLTIPVTL